MSTNYSLNNLEFTSENQSIFGPGSASTLSDSTVLPIADWDDGFNIDAFLDSIQITPEIRVRNPFTRRTLFTIPAVRIPINTGLQWDLSTSGDIDFEAGFNLTTGDIDSALNYDINLDFVDLFRVTSGQSFALADSASGLLTDGSFNTVSPDISAYAQLNYDVDFFSDLDVQLFGANLIPSFLDPVLGDVNIDFSGEYTIAEADLNGIRLLEAGSGFLIDLDLFDQKITLEADPFSKRITLSSESGEIIGIGKPDPLFTVDLADIVFTIPKVEAEGDLNSAGTQVEGDGSGRFVDLNIDADGIVSYITGIPFSFNVGVGDALDISADFLDIDIGPTLSLAQDFTLTPGDLQTTFLFQDLDGNPTTVLVNGVAQSSFTAPSFSDIPDLVLTEAIQVIPTFQPTAQLATETGVDLGFEGTLDFLKLLYTLKIPFGRASGKVIATGQLGPVFSDSLFETDPISLGSFSGGPFDLGGWSSFTGSPIILDVVGSGFDPGFSGIDDGFNDSAPVANNDTGFTTDEETDLTIDGTVLLANDFDPDAFDTLTITAVTAANGAATLNLDGTITYSPNDAFESLGVNDSGTDTLTYTIRDAVGRTATADVEITITGVNDPPVAVDDAFSIFGDFTNTGFLQEGRLVEFDVIANDLDVDASDVLALVEEGVTLISDLGSEITLGQSVDYGGDYDFGTGTVPGLGFPGEELDEVGEVKFDRVSYTVIDQSGATDTGEVYIVLFGEETDAPGYDPGFVISETSLTIPEGETGKFVIALQTAPTENVDITISPDVSGDATISSNQGLVSPNTIRFTPENWDIPQVIEIEAIADSEIEGDEITTLTLDVSSADTDYNTVASQTLDVTIQDSPAIIAVPSDVTVSESGTAATFDVNLATAPSSDVVVQVVSGDTGEATVSTSTLTFTSANWDQAQTVTVTGVDDVTLDGDQAVDITLSVDASQSDDDYDAVDAVTIQATVEDDENAPPNVLLDEVTTNEDTAINIDVLANDTDPTDTLMVTAVNPSSGEAVINNDNTITYTPDPDFNGTAFVTYTVSDGSNSVDSIAVITVNPVNDDPVAVDQLEATQEDTAITIDVVGDDLDVDGDTLTLDSVTNVMNGSVQIVNGAAVFTPDPDFTNATVTFVNGVAQYAFNDNADVAGFEYVVSDGNGGTDTGTVFVAVTPGNDAPIAVDDTLTIDEDTILSFPGTDLLANDTDIDLPNGESLTLVSIDSFDSSGFVSLDEDGVITYDPRTTDVPTDSSINVGSDPGLATDQKTGFDFLDDGETATDTFTYTIQDNLQEPATGTVTVTITGVNDAPVALDDAFQTIATSGSTDTVQFGSLLDNDFDPDANDTLTAVAEVITTQQRNPGDDPEGNPTGPNIATVTINTDGTFSYEYLGNLNLGSGEAYFDTFAYQVTDGDIPETATATIVTIGAPGTPGFALSESTLEVQEAAKFNEFFIALTAPPTSDVTLNVASSAPLDLVTDLETVTFTPDNWNVPQLVRVAPIDDFEVEPTEVATLTISVDSSSDATFTGVSDQTVDVTILDKEIVPEILVETVPESSTPGLDVLVLTEGGDAGEFTVTLATQPSSNVVLQVASTDTDEATVSTSTLTFTSANWDQPQTVTVTPGDDDVVGFNGFAGISLSVDPAQSDDTYDLVEDALVVAVVEENDEFPEFNGFLSVTIDENAISENGGSATGTVTRTGDTTEAIAVTLTSSDTTEATVPNTVTIQAGETSTTFTISGVNDDSVDGNFTVFITPDASGLAGGVTSIVVTDDDTDDNEVIPTVNGQQATIYVDSTNTVQGNAFQSGETYAGNLFSNTDGTANPDDVIAGTDGNDNIWAGELGNDTIGTGAGNDTIGYGSGDAWVDAGEGDDFVYAIGNNSGNNTIELGSGTDQFWATSGNNTITGSGNNTIGLGTGNDTVTTGAGNDFVYSINGGDGTNELNLGNGTNTIWVEGGDYLITTGSGNDSIGLGTGTDTVDAGDGNNNIYMVDPSGTNDGNKDVLTGVGDDYVQTGSGDDLIDAGTGLNTLFGGTGADTFTIRSGAYNFIGDFERGTDQIALADFSFGDLTFFQGTGNNANNAIGFINNSTEAVLEVANTTVEELNNIANFV